MTGRLAKPPLLLRLAALGVVGFVTQMALAGQTAWAGRLAGRPILIGAVFPLGDMQAPLARQELEGVRIAASFADQDGGIHGRPVRLVVRNLVSAEQASSVIGSLRRAGVSAVIGAYSSQLSIPAAAAASRAGILYWEAGAVADRLTEPRSPLVFRVGATGSDLGANSARFAATEIAPRLGRSAGSTRVAVVYEEDAYGQSVADAALRTARQAGMPIVADIRYDAWAPRFSPILKALSSARPDVVILASYIPDGVAFRRAMLASGLRVGALIGSTMAECGPTFGGELGPDAVGVFASDAPEGGFNPAALLPSGRRDYQRFVSAWRARTGQHEPPEDGLTGFTAAWTLLHDVLPSAHTLAATAIARAARATTLPMGSLPNGAGLSFVGGQNMRAAAIIWQWQAPRRSVVVWPPTYATGSPRFVPLPA